MDDAVTASLLWGLVGALSFLVLALGYDLTAGAPVGPAAIGGVALVVFLATAVATHLLRPTVVRRNERT